MAVNVKINEKPACLNFNGGAVFEFRAVTVLFGKMQ